MRTCCGAQLAAPAHEAPAVVTLNAQNGFLLRVMRLQEQGGAASTLGSSSLGAQSQEPRPQGHGQMELRVPAAPQSLKGTPRCACPSRTLTNACAAGLCGDTAVGGCGQRTQTGPTGPSLPLPLSLTTTRACAP